MDTRRLWPVALALAVAAAGAHAENPKVALKIEGGTLIDAMARLSEASGVVVDLYPYAGQGSDQKASFDWTGVPFAKALRQLCAKYDLQPRRSATGYTLYPASAPPPGPALPRVGLVEKDGYRLFARSVTVEGKRTKNFLGEPVSDEARLQIQVMAELGEGDADAIAGVENLTAKDDQGNLLQPDRSRITYGSVYGFPYPDEWGGTLALTMPSPKAKKLAWISGDLMAYRVVRPLKVEIPLPPTEKSTRRQAGDWLIVVSQYEASHKEPEDDDTGLPPIGIPSLSSGPGFRLRVYYPIRSTVSSRVGWGIYPTLVGASGRVYNPISSGGRGAGSTDLTMTDSRLVFPDLGADKPSKLVWNLVEKAQPTRLFSFRMADIPLPEAPVAPPHSARPAENPHQSLPDDHPYYQRGGGVVVTRILFGDRPVEEGHLQVGLAPKQGRGWGAIRWTEIDVDADGLARLEGVKPGAYQLHRVYRSRSGAKTPGGQGAWVASQVPVTVTAGKEITPAPLRWNGR